MRTNLVFMVILATVALLFQLLFVTNAQSTINDINELGHEYLDEDDKILRGLLDLDVILNTMYNEQTGVIMSQLLFEGEVETDIGLSTYEVYKHAFGNVSKAIRIRNESAYNLTQIKDSSAFVDIFSGISHQITSFDSENNFADTNNTGVGGIFFKLEKDLEDQPKADEVIQRFNLQRQLHNQAVKDILIDPTISSSGVLPTILTILDRIRERISDPNTVSQDAVNSDEILRLIFEYYTETTSLLINLELTQTRFDPQNEYTKTEIIEFYESTFDYVNNKHITIEDIRRDLTDLIVDSANDNDILAILVVYQNTRARILGVLEEMLLFLPLFVHSQKQAIREIFPLVESEKEIFKAEFNKFIDELNQNLATQIQFVSLLWILVLSITGGYSSRKGLQVAKRENSATSKTENTNIKISESLFTD